jgi:hypothetical protein
MKYKEDKKKGAKAATQDGGLFASDQVDSWDESAE